MAEQNLNLNVTADTSSAEKKIQGLTATIEEVGAAATDTASAIESIGSAEVGTVVKAISNLSSDLGNVTTKAHEAAAAIRSAFEGAYNKTSLAKINDAFKASGAATRISRTAGGLSIGVEKSPIQKFIDDSLGIGRKSIYNETDFKGLSKLAEKQYAAVFDGAEEAYRRATQERGFGDHVTSLGGTGFRDALDAQFGLGAYAPRRYTESDSAYVQMLREEQAAVEEIQGNLVTSLSGKGLQSLIDTNLGIGKHDVYSAKDSALAQMLREEEAAAKADEAAQKELAKAQETAARAAERAAKAAEKDARAKESASSSARTATHNTAMFSGSVGHLVNQFKRIAIYRVFKGILKGITDSFKIGTQNLVQYSAAMNGVDAAAANPTMSEYATQLLYVRNSVGAAAMPALQALIPTIQTVASWFVAAANAVNQFISVLQGKSTFTKAKEYAVDYAESIGGIGSAASKAAKQLQQLMDFDEINNIISPKDSGGGGGGGAASAQNPSEMFEEALIDSKFKKIAETAKTIFGIFKDLLPVIEAIGAGILLWKLSTSFAGALSNLWNMSGLPAFTTGITLLIVGAKVAYEGGKLMVDEETRVLGAVTSALGTLAAGIGGKLLLGGLLGSGAGFAIGITVGLFFTLKGYLDGKIQEEFESSELGQSIMAVNDSVMIIMSDLGEALDSLHEKVSNLDDITGKSDLAKVLVDRLYEIYGNGELSAGQMEIVSGLIEEINSLGLGDIITEYNSLTGEIGQTKDEVYAVIEAFEKQAKAKAYLELATEAEKTLAKATLANKQANEEVTKAQENYDAALVEYNKKVATMSPVQKRFFDVFQGGRKNVDEAKASLDNAKLAVEESQSAMDEAQGTIDAIVGGYYDLYRQADDAGEEVRDTKTAVKELDGAKASISVESSGFSSVGTALSNMVDNLRFLKNNRSVRIDASMSTAQATRYASGGFPTQGSLFLAGETVGDTEWLGNVNGRTGVVSGNEITGIADAVYNASAQETAELRTQNNLLTRLLEKQLTISPSAGLGRVNAQSAAMYAKVTGA